MPVQRRFTGAARRGYARCMAGDGKKAGSRAPGADQVLGRRGYQLAVLVLVGSLMAVWSYARTAGERERELANADFIAEAGILAGQLQQRLLAYELVALGGVSLFASVEWPSQAQWQDYVDGLRLEERFPGLPALGYAARLTPEGLADLQLARRAAGDGMYLVHPRGRRERYGPVVYLAGSGHGPAPVGYDLYADPVLRQAMDAALEQGLVQLSAPVDVRDSGGADAPPGLMMFAPVYARGAAPAGGGAGWRTGGRGWVYVPLNPDVLVGKVLAAGSGALQLRLVDAASARLVYQDEEFERTAAMPRAFRHSATQELYGRRWMLEFAAPPQPLAGLGLSAQQGTLGIGVVLSLLLFAMVWSLAHTRVRAEQLAARMSESWRRSEVRFGAAMEYSAIGKALLDHADRVVEANPALSRMLGLPPAALRGRAFDSWFAGEPGEQVPAGGDARAVVRMRRELRRPDGTRRHVQLTYAPVPGEIGSGVVRLVQVDDVTDQLLAEARVRELNRTLEARVAERTRELQQANHELELFAYSVSHDLRAPLRTVDSFGRLLADRSGDALDDQGRDYLSRIRGAAAHMDGLIDALLGMTRLSRAELRREPLDLSAMAQDVLEELRRADPQRQVDAQVQPGLRVTGDAVLMRNLLQNLLGNAWKFTRDTPDARIRFGCEPVDGEDVYCISDNGAGFDPAYASRLFKPFQRLHSAEEFAGHGVGLASVKRVVERHGGRVWAEGAPGQGACFRFTLPGSAGAGGA